MGPRTPATNEDNLTDYKVNDLQNNVDCLKTDIKLILSNHLPHLQVSMTELNGKVEGLATKINVLSAINVGAIIIGILVSRSL